MNEKPIKRDDDTFFCSRIGILRLWLCVFVYEWHIDVLHFECGKNCRFTCFYFLFVVCGRVYTERKFNILAVFWSVDFLWSLLVYFRSFDERFKVFRCKNINFMRNSDFCLIWTIKSWRRRVNLRKSYWNFGVSL